MYLVARPSTYDLKKTKNNRHHFIILNRVVKVEKEKSIGFYTLLNEVQLLNSDNGRVWQKSSDSLGWYGH